VALVAMWLSAGIADRLLDRDEAPASGVPLWPFAQRS